MVKKVHNYLLVVTRPLCFSGTWGICAFEKPEAKPDQYCWWLWQVFEQVELYELDHVFGSMGHEWCEPGLGKEETCNLLFFI